MRWVTVKLDDASSRHEVAGDGRNGCGRAWWRLCSRAPSARQGRALAVYVGACMRVSRGLANADRPRVEDDGAAWHGMAVLQARGEVVVVAGVVRRYGLQECSGVKPASKARTGRQQGHEQRWGLGSPVLTVRLGVGRPRGACSTLCRQIMWWWRCTAWWLGVTSWRGSSVRGQQSWTARGGA